MESQCHRFASITSCSYLLLTSWTAYLDMKEERYKKSGLICNRWDAFLEVASDLPRALNRKGKECYLIWFLAWRGWVYWSLLWHEYSLKTRRWQQSFRFVPRGRGAMAAVVGSFTLWLPTFARVAALPTFSETWCLRMRGGGFPTFGGYEWCEVH